MHRPFPSNHEKLIKAIQAKNEAEAQNLIAIMNITELSKVDDYGDTALNYAADNGLEKICEALIPKMTNHSINQINSYGNTALTLAIWQRLEKTCEMLIPRMHKESINQINRYGNTALTLAKSYELKKVYELLQKQLSYILNFDDSSDEEDSREIGTYTQKVLKEKLKDFKSSIGSSSTYNQYYPLSFVSHALGIKLLYSKTVQEKYYKLKQVYLAYNAKDLPNHSNIQTWIEECFNHILYVTYFKLSDNNIKTSQLIWQDFQKKYHKKIQENINNIIQDKRKFFKLLGKNEFEYVLNSFSTFKNSIVKKYFEEISENLFNDNIKNTFAEANDYNSLSGSNIKSDILRRIDNIIEPEDSYFSRIIQVIIENAGLASCNNLRTNNSIKSLVHQKLNKLKPNLENNGTALERENCLLIESIQECFNGFTAGNTIGTFRNRAKNKVKDLLFNSLKDPKTSNIFNDETIQFLLIKHGFVKLTFNKMQNYLIKNLEPNNNDWLKKLANELNSSYHAFLQDSMPPRITLVDHHNFDLSKVTGNDFFAEFLATLRLCNRSMKRMVKNRHDVEEYKYFKEEGVSRGWLFPCNKQFNNKHYVVDIQQLSTGTKVDKKTIYKRKDHTESLGKYQVIFDILNQIKETINNKLSENTKIQDAKIASWIKLILKGSQPLEKSIETKLNQHLLENVLKDLAKITYLIFGCEIVRNPAALIHNYMVLDLAEKSTYSWEQVLIKFYYEESDPIKYIGGIMPMTMKGAVKAVRKLHQEFSKYMPVPYEYDEDKTGDKKTFYLLYIEHDITVKWLSMKLGDFNFQLEDLKEEDTNFKKILGLISNMCTEGYGNVADDLISINGDSIDVS